MKLTFSLDRLRLGHRSHQLHPVLRQSAAGPADGCGICTSAGAPSGRRRDHTGTRASVDIARATVKDRRARKFHGSTTAVPDARDLRIPRGMVFHRTQSWRAPGVALITGTSLRALQTPNARVRGEVCAVERINAHKLPARMSRRSSSSKMDSPGARRGTLLRTRTLSRGPNGKNRSRS